MNYSESAWKDSWQILDARHKQLQADHDNLVNVLQLVKDTYDNGGWPDAVITIVDGTLEQVKRNKHGR